MNVQSTKVAFSPDRRQFVSFGFRSGMQIWYINEDGGSRQVPILQGHTNFVTSVAWSPNVKKKQIVSSSHDKTVRLWSINNEDGSVQPGLVLRGHTESVHTVAWSPDVSKKQVVSGSYDNTVRLWFIKEDDSGYESRILQGHTQSVESVAWSPDVKKKQVVSGSWDKTVRLWDIESGQPGPILRGHANAVSIVAWSPDVRKKQVVSGSWDKTIRLWSIKEDDSGYESGIILQGHTDYVRSVAWSPDGKQVAATSCDKTIKLWDAVSGNVVFDHDMHTPDPMIAYFSDKQQIYYFSHEGISAVTVCPTWTDRNNSYFSPAFRTFVFHLMCCKYRLEQESSSLSLIPCLPMEMWLEIILATTFF